MFARTCLQQALHLQARPRFSDLLLVGLYVRLHWNVGSAVPGTLKEEPMNKALMMRTNKTLLPIANVGSVL